MRPANPRRWWRAVFLGLVLAFVLPHAAYAATASPAPSAFDRRVDAISVRRLLTAPPAELVDPARQHGARVVTDLRQALFFLWAAAHIATFAWLWRSGRAARIRDALRRRLRSRVRLRLAFGAVLGSLPPLAGLPFALVSYRIGFNVGLTDEQLGFWLAHAALIGLADALAGAIMVTVALELVDRTRLWYVWFTAFVYVCALAVVTVYPVIMPSAYADAPLLAAHMDAAAPIEVRRTSGRTNTLVARTAGLGPFTRIMLGDTLARVTTEPELRYVIARQSAHVRHADVVKLALAGITLFVIAAALAVLISDRIGFRRDDDPLARLALVSALIGTMTIVLLPLYDAYARGLEWRADEDARQTLNDTVGAVRFLVRRSDDDMIPLCYRRSSSWYFADHPALGSRIAEMRGTQDPCPRSPFTR